MKILVLSDLHLEFADFRPPPDRLPPHDLVVLAGDIGPGDGLVQRILAMECFSTQVPIVLVPGNHEFYGLTRQRTLQSMRNAAEGTRVHVMDRDQAVFDIRSRRVRVLGATLWTDFRAMEGERLSTQESMFMARYGMNDYSAILEDGPSGDGTATGARRLDPKDTLREHQISRQWLWESMQAAPADETLVVVTHHAPSRRSISPSFAGDSLNASFVSELPRRFFSRAALWVHGHTHTSFDYVHHLTRVVANPRGYPILRHRNHAFENPEFREGLVVQV